MTTSPSEMMKAWICRRYGEPEILALIAFPGGSMSCHAEYRAVAANGPIAPKPANLSSPVHLDGAWRLLELQFRVFFKSEKRRQPQVTVTLRPPRVLQFRSAEHEQRIHDLIARNGLTRVCRACECLDDRLCR